MNRGASRRTIVESREERRFLLAQLARAVRRGQIEIHAFSLLDNHYHLLVRSPSGHLSEAMRRIQNTYSRFFNRRHRRDGSLWRGRFLSRAVETITYRALLVSYIDDNAVAAGRAATAADFPYSSAHWYAGRSGPVWLARGWVEAEVARIDPGCVYRAEQYPARFPSRLETDFREWVERRLSSSPDMRDALDDVLPATPAKVRAWMERKARLADGALPELPLVSPDSIERAVKAMDGAEPWRATHGVKTYDGASLARIGLWRDACALQHKEIALRCRLTENATRRRIDRHRKALREDPCHAARCERILADTIHRFTRL
ncbi:MAG: transposase [Planctomycetota bacterium]